jgi:hypothetical protein
MAFVAGCMLIASAGWAARTTLDKIDQVHDDMMADFLKPSGAYLWNLAHQKQTPAASPIPSPQIEIKREPVEAPPVTLND